MELPSVDLNHHSVDIKQTRDNRPDSRRELPSVAVGGRNPPEGANPLPEFRFVQGKPNCCPFKDYKCPYTGKAKKKVFIADIPLEERYKYIDPEQDINHPSMKVVGHCRNKLENPMEIKVKEQADMINTLSSHLTEMTLQINKLTEKLFSQDKSNGK